MIKTLVLKFEIGGNLRFLSHHETSSMFQRALIRGRAELCYSQGFNPRPRLSLPLPRSVGVASDDELLYAKVCCEQDWSVGDWQGRIQSHLPDGCRLIGIELVEGKVSFQPKSAEYVFAVNDLKSNEKLIADIDDLRRRLDSGGAIVVRRQWGRAKPARDVDVGLYIDKIECHKDCFSVKCKITSSGTVRVEEILELLKIDSSQLSAPVKRKAVEWLRN